VSTAAAAPPVIENRFIPEVLSVLHPATADEVATILNRSQSKQCQLDPAPTWLVKRASDILAPVIAGMCNASFQQSVLPANCKRAMIRPLLMKSSLDPNDPSSYRLTSNLSFVSKIIEEIVDARISSHTSKHKLPPFSLPVSPPSISLDGDGGHLCRKQHVNGHGSRSRRRAHVVGPIGRIRYCRPQDPC
jgi:hypothetical protein